MRVDETVHLTGLVLDAFVGHVSTLGPHLSEGKSAHDHIFDIKSIKVTSINIC